MEQVRMSVESMFRTIQNDVTRLHLAQNRTTTAISTNRRINAPSDSTYLGDHPEQPSLLARGGPIPPQPGVG